MTKESTFQSTVIKHLKTKGCYVIKTGGLGTPKGCPDVIALIDGGGWIAPEIKTSKYAKLQPLQKATIKKLNDMYWSGLVYPENWAEIKKEWDTII